MRPAFADDSIAIHDAAQQIKKIVRGTYDAGIPTAFVHHALELLVSDA
jgi:hypothetical protein